MSFEADLKAHLQADATISGLVADRIHPLILPQGSPTVAITYTLIFGELQNSLDGFTSGLSRISVQLDCWSQSFGTALTLALAVRDRMNIPAATFSTVITEYPTLDDYELDTKRYRRSIGCACWFTE
jgi:hypothetical protein